MRKKPASVHTIGYEQSNLDEFIARLANAHVDVIVDVRAVPLSRKAGFSKKQLSAALTNVEVEYKHIVGLGAPRDIRDRLRSGGDWTEYERCYRLHLEKHEMELQGLLDLAGERVICLLCFERDPTVCHRSLIAQRMADKQPGLVVHHIRY